MRALALLLALPAAAQTVVSAQYADPTTRYPHGVLGDEVEWATLEVALEEAAAPLRLSLPEAFVFEDLAPRLADMTGDGVPEAIAVVSGQEAGAQLVVFGVADDGLGGWEILPVAATDAIGRRFRWLAPVGVADFDGDGRPDIAYVETPHLGRTLRIVAMPEDGGAGRVPRLRQIAEAPGLSNHRIGEDFITGGVRDCGAGPEAITADAGWRFVMATRLDGSAAVSARLGPFSQEAVADALACR